MKWLLTILITLMAWNLTAQNAQEESIQEWEEILANATHDTTRVRAYYNLAMDYRSFDFEKCQEYNRLALEIAIKTNERYYVANALLTNSTDLVYLGEYDQAILYSRKAMEVAQVDTVSITNNTYHENILLAKIYTSIGNVYDYKSEFANAIKNYLSAISLFEHVGYTDGAAVNYNNLGVCYLYMKDYENAELNFQITYDTYMSLGDTTAAVQAQTNLGIIAYVNGDPEEGIRIFRKSAHEMTLAGNLRSASRNYSNMAEVYNELFIYDSASFYLNKAIEIETQLEDIEGLSASYRIMGKIKMNQKKYSEARENLLNSLEISYQIYRKFDIRECYEFLYELEQLSGNDQKALEYHKLYVAYGDSIQIENNSTEIGKIEAENEFNKQLAIQKAEDEQKLKLEEEKSVTQKIINYFIFAVIFVILIFVYIVWRSLKSAKAQKVLATEAKNEIEIKNGEILDSIKYAKRIQEALLKEDQVSSDLPPHFMYYQPKDIVSGDFYWSYRNDNYWYVAAADCTGHGVPGAMLTMLGNAYLNELCAKGQNPEPAILLDQLKAKITKELSQKGKQGGSKDGMDISLVKIDLKSNKATWAGANNPLYIIRNDELTEVKGNKQPIGYSEKVDPFVNHNLEIQSGDQIYLFSDGYADQFGGEKGKKFKYSNFKKLLIETRLLSPEDQKKRLKAELNNWRGELEQLDDICVIGVRL